MFKKLSRNHNYTSRKINLGSDIVFNKLIEHNVKDVFLYSGGAIMSLIDKLYNQNKIKYYVNAHEQNCGHAATGYARSTNKTGIVISTSGPGLTNLITPMLDAQNDSTPLIVLSGQVPISVMGTTAFQECPATEITSVFTKWSYCVKDIEELPDIMNKAFEIANEGKKGVVHIDLPKCILNSEKLNYKNVPSIHFSTSKNYLKNRKKCINVTKIINNSKKPVIIAGQGCNNYPDELRELVINGNIPITTTIHAMGVFPESHNLSLKFLGMHGNPAANYAVQNADLIINLGGRFCDRTTGNVEKHAPNAKNIIHVNIEKREFNKTVKSDYNFNMDCGKFINYIKNDVNFKHRDIWNNQIKNWKNEMPIEFKKDGLLKVEEIISELNLQIDKDNTIITTGVGNHQMQTCQYIDWTTPKSFISSGSLGVMGFGLPAAIGVQIANPTKTVIDIDGDSSFMMTQSDLKTIKEYNLPVKMMIINNKTQAMVHTWEKLFFDERHVATLNKCNPSFVKLAESYDIDTLYCDSLEELPVIIELMLEHKNPILVEFRVKHSECLPLMAPGKALDDLILYRNYKGKLEKDGKDLPPS